MAEVLRFERDLYLESAITAACDNLPAGVACERRDDATAFVLAVQVATTNPDVAAIVTQIRHRAFVASAAGAEPPINPTLAAHEADAPWAILAPFALGDAVALGWSVAALAPTRSGANVLALAHPDHGEARVAVRRHQGTPVGVAATADLDFLLLNGGGGQVPTADSIGRAVRYLAAAIADRRAASATKTTAQVEDTSQPSASGLAADATPRRSVPVIDAASGAVRFEVDDTHMPRSAVYATILPFEARAWLDVSRSPSGGLAVALRLRTVGGTDDLRVLASDAVRAINRLVRDSEAHSIKTQVRTDEPRLSGAEIEALLAELAIAEPLTCGLGLTPERGPGHESLRVLNLRGTAACNSDCVFCVEKFDPAHRAMPKADTTRALILGGRGKFDMLFFASGEPTIHPKLFEYVETARQVGFTRFGMSSHFRTMADPYFTRRLLDAGFEFFDISLHAADPVGQLAVNPIDDGGHSLYEALKGVAVLQRLAHALGRRISITHKIVVTRQNIDDLEAIFRATYDRGVRHYIIQPVRAFNLDEARRALVDIAEAEIIPRVNAFLSATAGLGAIVKPYGFSRQGLIAAEHVEHEQNRVKNVYGRFRGAGRERTLSESTETRPAGSHWVEIQMGDSDRRCSFPAPPDRPVLDEALERGFELPFGCRMGSCGMCAGHLVAGSVDQRTQIFLSPEQIDRGLVLLCQAKPTSDLKLRMCSNDELDEI